MSFSTHQGTIFIYSGFLVMEIFQTDNYIFYKNIRLDMWDTYLMLRGI